MENIKQRKTLQGNPERFTQAKPESPYYAERPMTLSAWTQTMDNDFGLNKNTVLELPNVSDHGVNTIKVVCDKVRILQESLRQHVDFLSELCGNSAVENVQKNMMQYQIERAALPAERTFSPPQQQQQRFLTPPNSLVNMDIVEEIPTTSAEHNNYIAIENNLMNKSEISDRLKICLEEEQIPKSEVFEPAEPLPIQHVASTINVVTEEPPASSSSSLYSQAPHDSRTRYSNVLTLSNGNNINIDTTYTSKEPKQNIDCDKVMVSLGPNNTYIRAHIFNRIKWTSYSHATRQLLLEVFGKELLATHSLSGRPCPAFRNQNRPTKGMLDQLKVQDIIFVVKYKCGASEKEIRNSITTKCADANKMIRKRVNCNSLPNKSITDKENSKI